MKCYVKRPVMDAGRVHRVGTELDLDPDVYLRLREAGCVELVEERAAYAEADRKAAEARASAEKSALEAAELARMEASEKAAAVREERESAEPASRRGKKG